MKKLRTILIDDENHCNETLKYELDRHCPQVEVVDVCSSAMEGLTSIDQHQPDLVFLDIEMPKLNGIEMLSKISPVNFSVIFVTAYDQYAIKAFRLSAVDYLLKPVMSDVLIEAVEKAVNRNMSTSFQEHINTLLQNMQKPILTETARIALPTREGLDFVHVRDIIRCQSESNYTTIYFSNRKSLLLAKTLKELEHLLEEFGFFRCHQSHIIQLSFVEKFVRRDGGYLVMVDGIKIPVSKRKREACLERLRIT